jgi:hypothetical protein
MAPKAKANAKKVAKRIRDQSQRVRHRPDRQEEHQIHWTEYRLKTMEASESAAFKTWELVKRGKTEVMKDRCAEFMKAYRETGSFKFVMALKWNRHLVVEEIDQNRGFFTEALILQKEAGQHAVHSQHNRSSNNKQPSRVRRVP